MKNNDQLDMLLTEKDVENPTKIFIKYNLSNLNQNHIYEIEENLRSEIDELLHHKYNISEFIDDDEWLSGSIKKNET